MPASAHLSLVVSAPDMRDHRPDEAWVGELVVGPRSVSRPAATWDPPLDPQLLLSGYGGERVCIRPPKGQVAVGRSVGDDSPRPVNYFR
jgi:hypothetical protein